MEEQFDLGRYEEPGDSINVGQMKETDILSDDDDYCKSVRAASAEPDRLEGRMEGLDLRVNEARGHNLNGGAGSEVMLSGAPEEDVDRVKPGEDSGSRGVSLSRCATPTVKLGPLKQCVAEGATSKSRDVIWVRRDNFANGCKSDVF